MNLPSPGKAFILDFDGTITTRDTTSVLAKFGMSFQYQRGVDMEEAWDAITSKYSLNYANHADNYKPSITDRRTLDAEIQYQRSLRQLEERSFRRVSSSGIFKGITQVEWMAAGREAVRTGEVTLRNGFGAFIQALRGRGAVWGVVSVNFSSAFIRGVTEEEEEEEEDVRAGLYYGEDVELLLANNPDENGVLRGPSIQMGELGEVVTTSDSKLVLMRYLLSCWTKSGSLCTSKAVYIGDSGTDIECLVEPSVIGIVMSEDEQNSVVGTMQRIGIDVLHIGEYREAAQCVYWSRDFYEITRSPLLVANDDC